MIYGSHIYLIIKAIHIIFMVSYFAGIFYLIRIFVYHKDAEQKDLIEKQILQKQYIFMAKRLWNIIIVPAGSIMTVAGLTMLFASDFMLLKQIWMHLKLFFLLGLIAYHYFSWRKLSDLKNNALTSSSIQLRMLNEIATVLLFLIVFTVVLKSQLIIIWKEVLLGFIVLFILIFGIVKMVNKK